jgi:LPS export ABC transporter protein LptC
VAVKIFAIILLLLIMEITFLSTQEPITLEIKQPKIDFSDITFEQLNAYLITTEGLKGKLEASKALAYKERNELYDIYSILYFEDHNDTLKADKAVYRQNILHLINNVLYRSNATFLLKSDDLVYNTDTERVVSHTPFFLEYNSSTAEGSYLVYDAKSGEIKAKNIVFTIEEDQ